MTDFRIRRLGDDDFRAAHTMFRGALHVGPAPDDQWEYARQSYSADNTWGAFDGTALIGTTQAFPGELCLPGGATATLRAVSRVGVRADHTRRGVLTELMRAQLDDFAASDVVVAALWASEPTIYGRFGYGVSTFGLSTTVRARLATLRPEVPTTGQVRLVDVAAAPTLLPELYQRIWANRPGTISRDRSWWTIMYDRAIANGEHIVVAVHSGPDGDDGFVTYKARSRDGFDDRDQSVTLELQDFHAATGAAAIGLWRFLTRIDLVDEIVVDERPVDEPLGAMFVNARAVHSQRLESALWLRLVDAEAALDRRAYNAAEPIVLELRDRMLPANDGRYRIGQDGARRTDAPAQLTMDADVLGMIYLGGTPPSALAGIGRITVHDPAAVSRADRLFATDVAPWCGTFF